MKTAIVILNYNGLENTIECLNSIKKLKTSKGPIEIIIVDNGSSDNSVQKLSQLKDIYFIANQTNLGFSGGNNVGIKKALARGAKFVLIINNDTIVDVKMLENLLNANKIGDIICPKIYFAKGYEFHKRRYENKDLGNVIWYAGGKIDWQNILGIHIGVDQVDIGQFNKRGETDFATGACMLIKKDVFEKIGLLDEKFFLYLEDMDFCVKAKKAGFKIIYEPKAFLWHKNAASSGGSGSNVQDYYITRNRLLFAAKHATLRTKFAVLKQIILQVNNPIKRKALLDFTLMCFGKAKGSL